MRNTRYENGRRLLLSRPEAVKRIRYLIREELTDTQREVLIAYYFREMSIPEIAAERGVYKSAVCRVLQRAENRLKKYL